MNLLDLEEDSPTQVIQEMHKTQLLLSQIITPEMKESTPGFDLILTLGVIISIATGVTFKRRKKD